MNNNRAHTILGAVITSHGGQLMTSNAFCKVYLTGYLVDYPEEKKILIELKLMELPKTLLAFVNAEISNTDLFEYIRKVSENSRESTDSVAWGVDAWAAAAGITETMRRVIRQQCFPNVFQEINSDRSLNIEPVLVEEPTVASQQPTPAHRSPIGFGVKLLATVAGVSGLIVFQVFGGNTPAPLKFPVMVPQQVTAKPQDISIKPATEEALQLIPTLAASLVLTEPEPKAVETLKVAESPKVVELPEIIELPQTIQPSKPFEHKVVQLNKPIVTTNANSLNLTSLESKQKIEKLHADVQSFLKYGN